MISAVGAAVLVGIGAYLTVVHHAGGALVLVIGCVCLLFSFALVPLARRRAARGLPSNSPDLPGWLTIISPCLITPGVADAFDHQFGVSSIVFMGVSLQVCKGVTQGNRIAGGYTRRFGRENRS